MKNRTFSLVAALAAAVSLPVATSSLAAQDIVAVKAGKLITIAGAALSDAVVLIENGKIKAIGSAKDVEVPWDAKVIDASKQVVMPTYVVAHTSGGMSAGNERMANVPYLTVQDAVDPASRYFEESLRNGVGTVHVIPGNETLLGGSGMVVRPYGKTVEDMAVLSKTGLKMSLGASRGGSRMAQIQKMRRALKDVKEYMADYERRKKEFAEEKAAGATEKEKFEEKIDEKKQPVVDLLEGKATAYFYVPSTAELYEAVRLINEYKLKVVLVLGSRCHKAAKNLKNLKTPIVLDATMEYYEKDPETDEEEKHCPAASLSKEGVTWAMSLSTSTSTMSRYPWWQMATAIRNGVSRDEALKTLTVVPAKILGLEDQVGTLEVGKRANIQILTGDPLQATSWVDKVLLDGELVYQRDKDARLQHLFGKSEEKSTEKKGSK
ncbi:MAG: amidohydrolase family protein [Planctomycetota bacterium]|jgi:imidazolonepropionase-like amidohydrolase